MEYRILEGRTGVFYPQYRYDRGGKWSYLSGVLKNGCIGTVVEDNEKDAKAVLMNSSKWQGGKESDIRSFKE